MISGIAWKEFAAGLKQKCKEDKLTDIAASLTFFAVLALFPFLLFLVTLTGLVLRPEQIEQLILEVGKVAPADATRIIAQQIRDINQGQNVGLLTVGFVGAIWSASGGIASLMDALNGVHRVADGRPFWKTRGIAILTTLGAGAAVLVAALVGVAAGPIAKAIGGPVATAVTWLRLPIAGVMMAIVWALLYYVLPDVRQRLRLITPGSVLGVVVWVIASWGFSFYVAHFGDYNKTYGAIGGAIVMLMWMWISAIFLILGAEINAVLEHISSDGKAAKSPAVDTGAADLHRTQERSVSPVVAAPARGDLHPRHARRTGRTILRATLGVGLLYLFGRGARRA
jgi:membrane protein